MINMGEFGRTPKINADAGRDHWPDCYSAVLAGGGVKGGQVYGSTDRLGTRPHTKAVVPSNIHATIYHVLGIDPKLHLLDPSGRPVAVLDDPKPIAELL